MKNNKIILAALIGALSTNLFAAEPSFNKIEFGRASWDFDSPFDPNFSGFEMRASSMMGENVYLASSYASLTGEDSFDFLDFTMFEFGVGYKMDLSESMALFGEIDYVSTEVTGFGSDSSNGNQAKLGIKSMLTESLEITVALESLSIDGERSNSTVLGAAYNVSENLAFYVDIKSETDLDRTNIGIRMNF